MLPSSSIIRGTPLPGGNTPIFGSNVTLWLENGVVYQAVPGTATHTWGVVGFQNLAAYTHFCALHGYVPINPGAYPATSPFSSNDFPMSIVTFNYVNPPTPAVFVVASQGATPFAATVIPGIINNLKIGEFSSGQLPAATRVTWAQATSLKVTSTNGPQTVSLKYLLLIPIQIVTWYRNVDAKNGEVFWTDYGTQYASWGKYGNGTNVGS